MKPLHTLSRICLPIIVVFLLNLPTLAQERTPLPFELAYDATEFTAYDVPALSPNGRYLVYTLSKPTPINETEASQYETLAGTYIHLMNLQTRETTPLGADAAASYGASWSPDSTRLVYFALEDGLLSVYVYDVATAESRHVITGAFDDGLVGGNMVWHPDGQRIALNLQAGDVLAEQAPIELEAPADDAQVITYSTDDELMSTVEQSLGSPSELALINVETGLVQRLTSLADYPLTSDPQFSPSGEWLLLLVNAHIDTSVTGDFGVDLAAVRLADGEIFMLDSAIALPESQLLGERFLGWHPTQDRMFYIKDSALYSVDLSADNRQPLRLSAEAQMLTGTQLGVSEDGEFVFSPVIAEDDVIRQIEVIAVDGSESSTLTLPEGSHLITMAKQSGITVWQPEPDTLTVVAINEQTRHNQVVRFDLTDRRAEILRDERSAFFGELTYTAAPDDGSALYLFYQSFNVPLALARIDPSAQNLETLVTADTRMDEIPLGEVTYFETSFTDDEGNAHTLNTAVLLPPGAQPGDDLPTIVEQYGGADLSTAGLTHGGGVVGSMPSAIFTTRGYQVLQVEIPLGEEGEPRNIRQAITNAVVAQVEQGIALGFVNPDRVAVTGQSFGGFGVAAILSSTDIFKAGVAVAGVYDLPATYAWDLDNFGIFWSENGQGRMVDQLWDAPERYIENSPYYHADNINTPLLLIHGEQDTTCPYEEAQKMFVALRRLDRDVDYLLYPRGGHVIMEWEYADAVDVTERTLAFLDQHLNQ